MHFSELGDEFVIAIMKKTVYILCFLMILSAMIPAIADSRETLVQQEAEEIVRNSFNADYGVMDYYEQCLNEYGIFRNWSVEQKSWTCGILSYLVEAEKDRLKQYHPEWIPSDLLEKTVLQWSYGFQEPGMIPQEDAVKTAIQFMASEYNIDCSTWKTSESLYTGHWVKEFMNPYWVIRFYDHAVLQAEVWINSYSGHKPRHQMLDIRNLAELEFAKKLQEGYVVAGRPVTKDMITEDDITLVYLEEENMWTALFRIEDSYWEISIDDETLNVVESNTSNG